jgi:hypothetical protein
MAGTVTSPFAYWPMPTPGVGALGSRIRGKKRLWGDLKPDLYPELIPPTVAEVRRLIRAMMGSDEKRELRLGWSLFRRAHQAVAKRSHQEYAFIRPCCHPAHPHRNTL